MIGVQIYPVDTWFFRDGTPFEDTPWLDVESLFPPHPPTLVGALRAAVARENGWNGRGRWSQEICQVLGDGPDDLGRISIRGPFLLSDDQPLYRVPRHLLGVTENERWSPRTFLRPGGRVVCDLGEVRLPALDRAHDDNDRLTPGSDQWLTASGMKAVLGGNVPDADQVIPSRQLWKTEHRTGLTRDARTRTSVEGMLWNTGHVRPVTGVSLGALISGLPDAWTFPFGKASPLGGESRLALLDPWYGSLNIGVSDVDTQVQGTKTALVALTPLDISPAVCRGQAPLEELGGARVVSVCMDRPLRIGGWDSRSGHFGPGPLPMRSVLPPGSVLFCEVDGSDPREGMAMRSRNRAIRIGARTRSGFGLVALGAWPGNEENR